MFKILRRNSHKRTDLFVRSMRVCLVQIKALDLSIVLLVLAVAYISEKVYGNEKKKYQIKKKKKTTEANFL